MKIGYAHVIIGMSIPLGWIIHHLYPCTMGVFSKPFIKVHILCMDFLLRFLIRPRKRAKIRNVYRRLVERPNWFVCFTTVIDVIAVLIECYVRFVTKWTFWTRCYFQNNVYIPHKSHWWVLPPHNLVYKTSSLLVGHSGDVYINQTVWLFFVYDSLHVLLRIFQFLLVIYLKNMRFLPIFQPTCI